MRRFDTGTPMQPRRRMRRKRAGGAVTPPPEAADTGGPAPSPPAQPETLERIRYAGLDGVKAQKTVFLEMYAQVGNISRAAELAGIHRNCHYQWLQLDPEYPERFAVAQAQAVDVLETEARRRAVQGYERPVYQMGALVGVTREYSDPLLIFLLKGARPEVYRERSDITLDANITKIKAMSDAEIHAALLQYAARVTKPYAGD